MDAKLLEEISQRSGLDQNIIKQMSDSGMVFRYGPLHLVKRQAVEGEGAGDQGGNQETLEAIMTTEDPALVWDWRSGRAVHEVLLMKGCKIPDTRQVPMLDSHWSWGGVADCIKGSFRGIRTENGSLLGNPVLSSLAEKESILIKEGHLTDISSGYRTYDDATVRCAPGQSVNVEGRDFINDFNDGLDLLVRTMWDMKEGSLVTIGADERSKFRTDTLISDYMQRSAINNGSAPGNDPDHGSTIVIKQNERKEPIMAELTPDEIRQQERKRVEEITARAEQLKQFVPEATDMARKAIEAGTAPEMYAMEVMDKMAGRSFVQTPVSQGIASRKNIDEYDMARAMRNVLAAREGGVVERCLEQELSDEIAQNAKRKHIAVTSHGGLLVPLEVMHRAVGKYLGTRTVLSTQNPTTGGNLVPQEFHGEMFIDILRNKTVMGKLGMTILSNLGGNIIIPQQLTGSTYQMVGYGAADMSNLTIGQVPASPKFGSASTSYHRSLLLQSGIGIEGLVTGDLFMQTNVGVDKEIIQGDGGIRVTGLMHVSGARGIVPPDTGIDRKTILKFEENYATDNVDQLGELKFLLTPAVRTLLKTTPRLGTQFPVFLMDDDGKIEGRQSETSNQVPAQTIIGSVFETGMRLDWGLYEILVNPYGQDSRSGIIEVTLFNAFDYIQRYPQAVQVSTGINLGS